MPQGIGFFESFWQFVKISERYKALYFYRFFDIINNKKKFMPFRALIVRIIWDAAVLR